MNKKILLTVLPLMALVSCSAEEVAEAAKFFYENGLPTISLRDSSHVTYLMLSPFGSIENYEGVSAKGEVSDLFYENTVVLKAEPGTALPNATQVVSSVAGATFRGWAYYDESNEHVWPDYYDKVPATSGLALKAIFDGTNASSGGGSQGGGGGGGEVAQTTYTITNFENWIPNDGAVVFAWGWGPGNGGTWYKLTLSMDGTNHDYSNVTGTFFAPDNLEGFNMARCSEGTSEPNWKATGDSAGRVYNKTADVTVRPGTTTYSSPEFVEYEYKE